MGNHGTTAGAGGVSRQEHELEPPLLEFVTTAVVEGSPEFDVGDHFRKDNPYGVEFGFIGKNFKKIFGKKIERNVPAATLRIHCLARPAKYSEIIVALGDKHSALVAWLWQLVRLQPNGWDSAPGVLPTNHGTPTILVEVPDDEGVLWAVETHWLGNGWFVDAYSIDGYLPGLDAWRAGCQVVSL